MSGENVTLEDYKFCQPHLDTVVALPLEMQKVMFSTIFSSSFENTANFTNTPTFIEHAASYDNEECLTLQRVNSVQTRNKNLYVWYKYLYFLFHVHVYICTLG